MPWFKVDDGLPFHRKVVAAGNPAMGLWVRAGAWSAHELTDGFVPDHMLPIMGTPAQVAKLIKVGLWVRVAGGVRFHQWNEEDRQPTSQSVREKRARAAKRQAEWRARRAAGFGAEAQVPASSNGVTEPLVTPLVTAGVTPAVTAIPTRPDPTSSPYGEEETTPLPPADAAGAPGRPKSTSAKRPAEPAGFAEWYAAYPRHEARARAVTAYRTALGKRGITPEVLLAGARRYARLVEAEGREPCKIAHPATWLNGERWADETPPTARRPVGPAALPEDPAAAFDDLRRRADARQAAEIAGIVYRVDEQPPSDPTDPREWDRARRVEWIDQHGPQIKDALVAAHNLRAHKQEGG